jgi:hypothetical protein
MGGNLIMAARLNYKELSPNAYKAMLGLEKTVNSSGLERSLLVRQAKLGASCRVEVPAEQGLTNHSYRVLQL